MNLKLGIIQVSNFHENLTMLKVKLGFITTQFKSGCYFDSECAPRTAVRPQWPRTPLRLCETHLEVQDCLFSENRMSIH